MGNDISIFSKPKNEVMIEILDSFGIKVGSVFLDEGVMFDVYNIRKCVEENCLIFPCFNLDSENKGI